jgi:hypothetical protein
VREELRREVNFGCPFDGCGSPFLSWHHFDPPWREEPHHRAEGMIALCLAHAGFADGDSYTVERLRQLKRAPFVKATLAHQLPWQPENLTFFVGGAIVFGPRRALSLCGVDVFSARRTDDGRLALDAQMMDPEGHRLLTMQDNELSVHISRISDLECSTRGKNIKIVHWSGTRLGLRFETLSKEEFAKRAKGQTEVVDFAYASASDSDRRIPTIAITGHLFAGGLALRMAPCELVLTGGPIPPDDPVRFTPICMPGAAAIFQQQDRKTGKTLPMMTIG